MKFYDKKNKRILVFEESATSYFWDRHWRTNNLIEDIKKGKNNKFLKKFTNKFLKPSAKILEGGCGIGQNVYGLNYWGYEAYGVDFAKETVEGVKKEFPELKLFVQDVRKLDFPDNFFDGYWSLGVIEHFFNGYDEIIKEAKRVLKPGGYLFLAFPYMSPLRKLKARIGCYKRFDKKFSKNNFYQFILPPDKVISKVKKVGFKLLLKHPYDAAKGLKDEIYLCRIVFQRIYQSENIFSKGIRFLTSFFFSRVAGHMILLVFQKNEK
jgi:SAM-dependent methyltransferase